ncbi:MAG: hypothetical protein ACEPOV_02705 [Hyphomicrobiales bacterium]
MRQKSSFPIIEQEKQETLQLLECNLDLNNPFTLRLNRSELHKEIEVTIDLLEEVNNQRKKEPEKYKYKYILGLIHLAYLYQEEDDRSQSVYYFKKALSLLGDIKVNDEFNDQINSILRIKFSLGNLYLRDGFFRKARKEFITCKNLANELLLIDPEHYIYDLFIYIDGIGDYYYFTDKFGLAKLHYLKALEFYNTLDDESKDKLLRLYITLNYKISRLCKDQLNTKEAVHYCQIAISLLEDLRIKHSSMVEIRLSVNMLWIQLLIQDGDFENATHNFIDTELFFEDLSKHQQYPFLEIFAKISQELGDYYMISRVINNSKEFYRKALNYIQKVPHPNSFIKAEESAILNNLSAIYMEKKEVEKVEKLLFKSLNIRQELLKEDPEEHAIDYAGTLLNLAVFYSDLGIDKKSAKKLLEEALIIMREFNPEEYDTDEEKYSEIMTRAIIMNEQFER